MGEVLKTLAKEEEEGSKRIGSPSKCCPTNLDLRYHMLCLTGYGQSVSACVFDFFLLTCMVSSGTT